MRSTTPVCLGLALAAMIGAGAFAAAPGNLSGTWLSADGSSQIRFEPCGPAVCGRIVWIREPIDKATGRPVADSNNPDPKLKARPLVGITLLDGLKRAESGEWEGSVYNPRDGGVYDVSITLKDADRLTLTGCLFGFLCQSEAWTRVAVGVGAAQ